MTMPARLCAGRESEFRDPHMRLVDFNGCNSLWANGHGGFLSGGGIVDVWYGGFCHVRIRSRKPSSERRSRIVGYTRVGCVLVVYVLKGGRVKYTLPDGSTKISELKTGETLLRPPVTHSDEALDDVDSILIELKTR
jgi:hypothetical protein